MRVASISKNGVVCGVTTATTTTSASIAEILARRLMARGHSRPNRPVGRTASNKTSGAYSVK